MSARPSQLGDQAVRNLAPIREEIRSAERDGRRDRLDSAKPSLIPYAKLASQLHGPSENKENLRLPRIDSGRNMLQRQGSEILGGVI